MAHQRAPKYYQDVLKSVKGIAFMGVPHRGSGIARLGSFLAGLLKASTAGTSTNKNLIKELKKGARTLTDLSAAANQRLSELILYSFYETRRLHGEVVGLKF